MGQWYNQLLFCWPPCTVADNHDQSFNVHLSARMHNHFPKRYKMASDMHQTRHTRNFYHLVPPPNVRDWSNAGFPFNLAGSSPFHLSFGGETRKYLSIAPSGQYFIVLSLDIISHVLSLFYSLEVFSLPLFSFTPALPFRSLIPRCAVVWMR